ncbi:hypothetical protein BT63DRAFT_185168 [Microthyrium microscopicum]|uniref:F-box domain-containing protein n=1 Tax=Microthyrium microscopicum TaxID=703497 RepID=A0A6A6UIE3_9PEZI|nr:hypothetical protein BT63DRAFT_185168 [Microthyrium microscopicum]
MNSLPCEILAEIFVKLDLGDLLRIQRVCQHWTTIICASPTLQQALFFRPSQQRPDSEFGFNPLLKELFPPFFLTPITDIEDSDDEVESSMSQSADVVKDMQWFVDKERRNAVLRPDASWRRMFPIQPPIKLREIQFEHYYPCVYSTRTPRAQISSEFDELQEHGIKMGLLYDLVISQLDRDYVAELGDRVNDSANYFLLQWPSQASASNTEMTSSSSDLVLFMNSIIGCCGGKPEIWAVNGLQSAPLPEGLITHLKEEQSQNESRRSEPSEDAPEDESEDESEDELEDELEFGSISSFESLND